MRIAIVGPCPPIKGGVAAHTVVLATSLEQAGHEVQIVSWSKQYPGFLYPGEQLTSTPEFETSAPTHRILSWQRPDTWVRAGRQLRDVDVIVIAHITPVQVPAYRALIRAARGGSARVVLICHNVLPHERHRMDESLVSGLMSACDLVVTHSADQQALARRMTNRPVVWAPLAPFFPPAFAPRTPTPGEHRRLLFFGIVREYKGLEVLLQALAAGPADVRLRVAGEFWIAPETVVALCQDLGIADRVELRPGYVPADEVPSLFADVDALVVPYRHATGSQASWTGFQFGVPVIVTRTGTLAEGVVDGVDGFVAEPDDVKSLADVLDRFYEPGVPERLRSAVTPVDPAPLWNRYIEQLLTSDLTGLSAAPPGGRALHMAKLAAEETLWARVAAGRTVRSLRNAPRPMPTEVTPTEVLDSRATVERSVAECRRLGLPLHRDRPKNWDALGAVSTVLNHLGTDIRVIDAGAARYSSVLPWLRLYGVRELLGNNLEFRRVTTHGPVRFEPGDITDTAYPDGWFDAVTCMSVIEHGVPIDGFLAESARVLRPGGLLVVSTDYDQQPPNTAGMTAYGTAVKIFGPEGIREFAANAKSHGLDLVGELQLEHPERPVHWKRTGLDYTFIRLTFTRTED